MTASHLQILPPGPIKLIGLPPTATTMGVTNARVLHRRIINNNNNISNNLSSINNNTSSLSLGSAKRCLFGSPDPGVIKNLYEEELKRNRERFIQRYNYDIIDEKFVNENNTTTTTVNNKDDSIDNNKIIDEDCENRLHGQTNDNVNDVVDDDDDHYVNENKSDDDFSSTSNSSDDDTDDKCNLDNNSMKNAASSLLSSSPLKDKKLNERLKPYSRQAMITEFYANRKTTPALTTAIVGSSTTTSSVSSPTSTNTVLVVSQLPKPQKAQLFDQQIQSPPSPLPPPSSSVGQSDEKA